MGVSRSHGLGKVVVGVEGGGVEGGGVEWVSAKNGSVLN